MLGDSVLTQVKDPMNPLIGKGVKTNDKLKLEKNGVVECHNPPDHALGVI